MQSIVCKKISYCVQYHCVSVSVLCCAALRVQMKEDWKLSLYFHKQRSFFIRFKLIAWKLCGGIMARHLVFLHLHALNLSRFVSTNIILDKCQVLITIGQKQNKNNFMVFFSRKRNVRFALWCISPAKKGGLIFN